MERKKNQHQDKLEETTVICFVNIFLSTYLSVRLPVWEIRVINESGLHLLSNKNACNEKEKSTIHRNLLKHFLHYTYLCPVTCVGDTCN